MQTTIQPQESTYYWFDTLYRKEINLAWKSFTPFSFCCYNFRLDLFCLKALALSPSGSVRSPGNNCTPETALWVDPDANHDGGWAVDWDYYCVSAGTVKNGEGETEGKIGVVTNSLSAGWINSWEFEQGSLVQYSCRNIPYELRCSGRVRRTQMRRIR